MVVFIRCIYFAFKSTNLSTVTLTWSTERSRVGKFIPVRLFEVHQMDKEQCSTYGAFCSLYAIMTPVGLLDLPRQLCT